MAVTEAMVGVENLTVARRMKMGRSDPSGTDIDGPLERNRIRASRETVLNDSLAIVELRNRIRMPN
jgi:hypothetical protein